MKYIALFVLALGCQDGTKAGGGGTAAPSRSYACNSALATFDHFVDVGSATPEARTKIKAAMIERCTVDGWSDDALACMRFATTSHATFECWSKKLTKVQLDAASKALADLK